MVEKKVKAAAAGSYLGGVAVLEVLESVKDNPLLLSSLPDWLEPFVLSLVITGVTFVSGWVARHTPRTDPAASRRRT